MFATDQCFISKTWAIIIFKGHYENEQADVRERATHMTYLFSLRRNCKQLLHQTLPNIYHGEFFPHITQMKK